MASSVLRITGLVWVNVLASYAISILITYLTNVWKLNFTHAAGIVNVFSGLAAMTPFTLQYIVDTFMGNYWMVLLSSLSYTIGLGFLSMSTPPVLSKADGTCSKYKPECIGIVQRTMFYTSLVLIVLGMSGHLTSLKPLIKEHKKSSPSNDKITTYLGVFGLILVIVVGAIMIPYIKPWSVRFGITAICSVLATLVFVTGSYNHVKAQGSPLTTVFRVFVASASKAFHRFPSDVSQLRDKHDDDNVVVNTIYPSCRLGFLDKAAIILPDHEQQNSKWKLCSVKEVAETKSFIHIIPICTTFFMLGVVSSFGNTYFLEQANRMNQTLGRVKAPLTVLIFLHNLAKSQFSNCYSRRTIDNITTRQRRSKALVGVGASMLFAVLCCVTAAKVESQRLDVVTSHGLVDKPRETIPMSMFWLLPQFLLLGGLDGNFHGSIGILFSGDDHDNNQGFASMERYKAHFAVAIFGVGNLGSVLSVCLVDKISSKGERLPSWFRDTLNRSRLDKYYWVLSAFSGANFVMYILVVIWYWRKCMRSEDMEEQKDSNQNEECLED